MGCKPQAQNRLYFSKLQPVRTKKNENHTPLIDADYVVDVRDEADQIVATFVLL